MLSVFRTYFVSALHMLGTPRTAASPCRLPCRLQPALSPLPPSPITSPPPLGCQYQEPVAAFSYHRCLFFSYHRYELGEKIGKGAHATVHIATDRVTGERWVVVGGGGDWQPFLV